MATNPFRKLPKEDIAGLQAIADNPKLAESSLAMARGGTRDGSDRAAAGPSQELKITVGAVLDVPVSELIQNPYNARRVPPSGELLDKLSASLLKEGQLTAATAFVNNKGRVCLIDGHRRQLAVKNAGLTTLRVEIRPEPVDEQALYLASRASNTEREPQSLMDDAIAWLQMLEQGTFKTQSELAKAVSIDEGDVSRTLHIMDLPYKIRDMLNGLPSLLNLRMLDSLRQYFAVCGEEATKKLILEADIDGLSSREVDKLRKASEKEKVPRTRSGTRVLVKYERGNATVRQFDTARKLVIEIDSVAVDVPLADVAERVQLALSAALGSES